MKELKNWNLAMTGNEFELGRSQFGVGMLNPEFVRTRIMDGLRNRMGGHQTISGISGENEAGEQTALKSFRMYGCKRNRRKILSIKDFQSVRVGSYKF